MKALTFATTLSLTAAAALGQGLVSYDGFGSGPAADLSGYSGGTGWTGPWQDWGSSLPTSVSPPTGGLTFQNLLTMPGAAHSVSGYLPDMNEYGRMHPAISGDAMFVSCLMRAEADFGGWYILRFGTYPAQVDLGSPIGYYVYGLTLGDGFIVPTNVPTTAGQTHLLVLEVVHTSAGQTSYSLFMDPTPGAPKPAYPAAAFTRGGILAFGTAVELRGEGGVTLDELRIGTTWDSVLPIERACGSADFDGDGSVGTDADITAFFACLAGNCCAACGSVDFNGDGDVGTDADIEAFFRVLAGGHC